MYVSHSVWIGILAQVWSVILPLLVLCDTFYAFGDTTRFAFCLHTWSQIFLYCNLSQKKTRFFMWHYLLLLRLNYIKKKAPMFKYTLCAMLYWHDERMHCDHILVELYLLLCFAIEIGRNQLEITCQKYWGGVFHIVLRGERIDQHSILIQFDIMWITAS